jgi:hypothetical protein
LIIDDDGTDEEDMSENVNKIEFFKKIINKKFYI